MSTPVITSFAKIVVRKLIGSFLDHELAAFTDGEYSTEANQTTDPVNVIRLQIRYAVVRTGLQPDVFENVLHFVNTAGELPGAPADNTQKAAVESAFGTFWGTAKGHCSNYVALDAYRWYHFNFDDILSGPPTRVTDVTNVAGGLSSAIPSQIATSITIRTALRRHWGRIYLPGAKWDPSLGMGTNTDIDSLTGAFRTFVNACQATQLTPVVYSKVKQAVMTLSSVEVDNVPDVVRRRRPKISTYRKIYDVAV